MNKKQRAALIVSGLKELYPLAECSLEAVKDYELLFATRLSAQCTDARVNIVTGELYSVFPTLPSLAEADIGELERIIFPCGFFHTKAADIKKCANVLIEKHGGRVPDTMEALLELPGVGRKTANLILGDIYGKPAVVADTHCIRISNRMGFCDSDNPYKVELALKDIIEPAEQSDFCHRLVYHGRAVCTARKAACEACTLAQWCDYGRSV